MAFVLIFQPNFTLPDAEPFTVEANTVPQAGDHIVFKPGRVAEVVPPLIYFTGHFDGAQHGHFSRVKVVLQAIT